MARIDDMLEHGRQLGGSDVHLTPGQPPLVRTDGELWRSDLAVLGTEETTELLVEILSPAQREQFSEQGTADFSYQVAGGGRYRINACRHHGWQ